MKKLSIGAGKRVTLVLALAVVGAAAAEVSATPSVNSAVINTRVFNDFPSSTLSFNDSYPASITISDDNSNLPPPPGFANLHNWRFSENNFTTATFNNGDAFSYSADFMLSAAAPTVAEGGLQVAPWWSVSDGRLQVRVQDGEIAAFGGRLPFYSFTAAHGISYAPGSVINLGISYDPNSLSMADPGTIKYDVFYGGNAYTSGWLAFDQGNPAEDPPHGLWGILSPAEVGGVFQAFNGTAGAATAQWSNIVFVPEPSSLLMLLGGALLARRRR